MFCVRNFSTLAAFRNHFSRIGQRCFWGYLSSPRKGLGILGMTVNSAGRFWTLVPVLQSLIHKFNNHAYIDLNLNHNTTITKIYNNYKDLLLQCLPDKTDYFFSVDMDLRVSPVVLSSLLDVTQIWNLKIWTYPKH